MNMDAKKIDNLALANERHGHGTREGIRELAFDEVLLVSGSRAACYAQRNRGPIAGAAAGLGAAAGARSAGPIVSTILRSAGLGARAGMGLGAAGIAGGAVLGAVIGGGAAYFFGGSGGSSQ